MLKPCLTPQGDCGFLGTPTDDSQPGVANLSAEAPDVDISTLLPYPSPWIRPPLSGGGGVGVPIINNPIYTGPQPCVEVIQGQFGVVLGGVVGAGGFVQVGVIEVVQGGCSPEVPPNPPGPVPNPDWPIPNSDPNGTSHQRIMFPNQQQSCTKACADGVSSTYTVQAGFYHAITGDLANQMALSLACKNATFNLMCFAGSFATTCADTSFSTTIFLSGTSRKIVWSVTGNLPPGLTTTPSTAAMALVVSGIPNVPGNYSFTLTATASTGVYSKTYTMSVIGITTDLPDPVVGVAYSQQIDVVGGNEGGTTFEVTAGTLPAGLTLYSNGLLAGTPTTELGYTFTVGVNRDGKTCTRQYFLTVGVGCPAFNVSYPSLFVTSADYVAATNRVWVSHTGGIRITNPDTGVEITDLAVGNVSTVKSVAAASRVFYEDSFSGDVRALNQTTFADEGALSVGAFKNLLPVYDETLNNVYLEGNELEIYNSSTLAMVAATADLLAVTWSPPAYCPVNDRLYVPVDGVGVRLYNPATGALISTIAYGAGSVFYGAVWSPESGRVVVNVFNGVASNYADFINPSTGLVTDSVLLLTENYSLPQTTTYRSGNSGLILMANGTTGIAVVNPVSKVVACIIPSTFIGENIAFATANRTMWVTYGPATNRVDVYDE